MSVRDRVVVLLAAASVCVSVGVVDATMQLRRLSLEAVTAEAGRIVYGTVADVRSGRDERGIPATWVTLDVARTVKGTHAARVTLKQLGTAEPLADGALGGVAGMPRYDVGEEMVLFLRTESAHGFTSPVGFEDGVYRVHADGGRRMVRSAEDQSRRVGHAEDIDAFVARVDALVRGTK